MARGWKKLAWSLSATLALTLISFKVASVASPAATLQRVNAVPAEWSSPRQMYQVDSGVSGWCLEDPASCAGDVGAAEARSVRPRDRHTTFENASPAVVHFPAAVQHTADQLPDLVMAHTRRNAGSLLIAGLETREITDLTLEPYGLIRMQRHDFSLDQLADDSMGSPGIFFQPGNHVTTLDIPVGSPRLAADIANSTALQLGLLLVFDANGNRVPDLADVTDEACLSVVEDVWETCSVSQPSAGLWFAIVINIEASAEPPDQVALNTGIVPAVNAGNMSFSGPTGVPAGQPFDLRLFWNEPAMGAGETWYGAVSLGSDPANPGDIAVIPVNVERHGDDVTKRANPEGAWPGEVVTFTITIQPNVTPQDLTYWITDTIPTGLTYVPGSATGGAVVSNGVLTWTGVMPTPEGPTGDYVMSTSETDPLCDTGYGGYLDLEEQGVLAQPIITGDIASWTAFSTGDPINYYGEEYVGMGFVDDGFAIFDFANYGGTPWVAQTLPERSVPNNVLGAYWHDLQIVYDAVLNHGVSLATDGFPGGWVVIEYDDVQLWGGSPSVMDFEIIMSREVIDQPGFYEIVFAYDNVNLLPKPVTVGVEDFRGVRSQALVNNSDATGVITNGLRVCFDHFGLNFDPVEIIYQAAVDAAVPAGTVIHNRALHATDDPGGAVDVASAAVAVLGPEPRWEKEVRVNNEIITGMVYSGLEVTDTVTVVDRVWIDSRENITFAQVGKWSESLELQAYELLPDANAHPGMDVMTGTGVLTFAARDLANDLTYVVTKTFDVAAGPWSYDIIRESLYVEGAATQHDDFRMELWHKGFHYYVPILTLDF